MDEFLRHCDALASKDNYAIYVQIVQQLLSMSIDRLHP